MDIDEFCAYNRALGGREIAWLANRSPGTAPPVPESEPGPAAPAPRSDPTARPYPVPSAAQFSGLKFYLTCDVLADGRLADAVTGKPFGKALGPVETVEGVRGKGIRLAHDKKDSNTHALDLSDLKDVLALPADKPFTLAFWARRAELTTQGQPNVVLVEARSAPGNPRTRSLTLDISQTHPTTNLEFVDKPEDTKNPTRVRQNHGTGGMLQWTHFAVTRDGQGKLRFAVNGSLTSSIACPLDLKYDVVRLVRSDGSKAVIDVDELCVFDRALAEAELNMLIGEQPLPKHGRVVTPLPKERQAVPAATEFAGLKFHLACDKTNGKQVWETVGKKFVGKSAGVELVDGPRGKAMKVNVNATGAREGFTLSDERDDLAVAAGKPFTLALWVRTDYDKTNMGSFLSASVRDLKLERTLNISSARPTSLSFYLLNKPAGANTVPPVTTGGEVPALKEWLHVAVTRDEKGGVRLAVNGEIKEVSKNGYAAEFRFERFVFGSRVSPAGTFAAEYDEFCLFDRVLADDELRKLAGRAK